MATQHKAQRVSVLVDVQNMYYSAKNMYGAKVNYAELLKTAVKGRQLIRAVGYVIKADVKEEKNFHEALERIGFEVRSKDLQIFYGGAKKGDWDVGIAMDCVRLAEKSDVIVLVSGDGDFRELVLYLQSHGCRVEVIAFSKSASTKLTEEADSFTDMCKEPRKFLIPASHSSSYSTAQSRQYVGRDNVRAAKERRE